ADKRDYKDSVPYGESGEAYKRDSDAVFQRPSRHAPPSVANQTSYSHHRWPNRNVVDDSVSSISTRRIHGTASGQSPTVQ
ncbi:unnamed protein product, partial [Sphagnum balticum]